MTSPSPHLDAAVHNQACSTLSGTNVTFGMRKQVKYRAAMNIYIGSGVGRSIRACTPNLYLFCFFFGIDITASRRTMAITSAVSDLVNSFYEFLSSIVGAVYWVVHSIASAVVGLFTGLGRLVGDIVGGAVHVAGGVGKFVLGKSEARDERNWS